MMEHDDRRPDPQSIVTMTALLAGLRADLVRFFTLRLGAAGAAEQIVDEIGSAIREGRLRPSDCDMGAKLFEVGTELVRDRLRTGRTARNRQATGSDAGELDAAGADERLRLMVGVLRELPADTLLILRLHKFEGRSFSEIAKMLNVTPDQVEQHIGSALRLLLRRGS